MYTFTSTFKAFIFCKLLKERKQVPLAMNLASLEKHLDYKVKLCHRVIVSLAFTQKSELLHVDYPAQKPLLPSNLFDLVVDFVVDAQGR